MSSVSPSRRLAQLCAHVSVRPRSRWVGAAAAQLRAVAAAGGDGVMKLEGSEEALRLIPWAEIVQKDGREEADLWIVVDEVVYDMTEFMCGAAARVSGQASAAT